MCTEAEEHSFATGLGLLQHYNGIGLYVRLTEE